MRVIAAREHLVIAAVDRPHLTQTCGECVKPHPGPEVDLRVPSIEKAMTLLGYKPTVSLESGVAQAIEWYRDNYDAVAGKK